MNLKINRLLTAFLLLLLTATALHAQTRRALVIGLGRQEDKSWGKINGDRDVPLVKAMLQRAGYGDVRTLVNEKATKAAIVLAFNRLTADARPGDIVYVHFSGHGQQMSDREGDEKDGWDEAWIPYDAYFRYGPQDNGSKHLTDDELNGLLTAIRRKIGRRGRLLVVADACHSGDSSRSNDDEVVRGTNDKFVIPGVKPAATREPLKETWIMLSACRDYQRNAELRTENGYVGRLTAALCSLTADATGADNERFFDQIGRFFDRNRTTGGLPQTPVMSGTTSGFNILEILKK